MKVSNLQYKNDIQILNKTSESFENLKCNLILVFGAKSQFENHSIQDQSATNFPNSQIISYSTAS